MSESPARSQTRKNLSPAEAQARILQWMNAGRLEAAEALCRQLVKAQPMLVDNYNVLAVIRQRQGDLDDAIACLREAIRLNGAVANYHANLGEMLRQKGDLESAIAALRRATRLDPGSPQAHNNLGIAWFDQGDFARAEQAYRCAIELQHEYPEAHNNLANALRAQGRAEEAREGYAEAIRQRPDYVEALYNRGILDAESGQAEAAEEAFRRVIERQPEREEAIHRLADVLFQQGRVEDATELLEQALARERSASGLVALTRARLRVSHFPEAGRLAEEALAAAPDDVQVQCVYGQACHELDRYDEALEWFGKALEQRPEYHECRISLANTYKTLGDLPRARAELERVLETHPDSYAALSALTDLKRFTADDPHLPLLQERVASASGQDDESEMFAHYPLAKAYDDMGDYDAAFHHYMEGARIKRSLQSFDEEASIRYFERIRSTFNHEFVRGAHAGAHPANLPIFIVGMPRSGSTLVEQVLASHPEVHGAGEVKFLSGALHATRNLFPELPRHPEIAPTLTNRQVEFLAQHYLTALSGTSETADRITDKLLTNFFFLGLIHMVFPNARVIHTRRNPVDTCVSCFTKLFRDEMAFSYDLGELGRYYRRYEALMSHWREVLPEGVMLEVNYEDMVVDLDSGARRIVDFCGLEWDDRCLAFHEAERPVKTASVTQVRKPIYKSSVERWRRYESHLRPLLEALDSSNR
ncbi:tetratricopeptide repeat-containing sulfotransferase family protein [Thioalkalivibrio sp. ALJ2]|uniref:tetratricopeptide repeat-containing sulfotransferase family protein n=1 Tax=Thioalkalivibrio sp. ALJ2 TaxID=1261622 RepID=UPI00035D8409|nr:tetratricopeptide repeat-containing sulfotransferase family protein [Thioalkalivibrio sp. ALJ2]